MNKIQKFIKDNHLNLNGIGSDLNSNCIVIAGYACYLGIDFDELLEQIDNLNTLLPSTIEELKQTYNHAKSNYYERYWHTSVAKQLYKF